MLNFWYIWFVLGIGAKKHIQNNIKKIYVYANYAKSIKTKVLLTQA
jgi:hypothetical protein